MKNALRFLTLACAAALALTVAGAASAAFTSPKLTIESASGGGIVIRAEQAREDDAPFQLIIYVPLGYTGQLVPQEGAQLGTVTARAQANAISPDAILELTGGIVGDPTFTTQEYPTATGCLALAGVTTPPAAVYRLVLSAAGQTIPVPLYVVPITSGPEAAFASAKLISCLASPYIPAAAGGAPFGAKLLSANLTFPSLFTAPSGAGELRWRSIWTPHVVNAPTATPNLAGRVEVQALAPAAGRLTLRVGTYSRRARRLNLRGTLTQATQGTAGTVQIFVGNRRVARVRAGANGNFATSIRLARRGTYRIRATATVAARETTGCTATIPTLTATCLRATASGFTASSLTVRARIR
jgi:hypothetical protein